MKRALQVICFALCGLALGLPAQTLVITAPNGGETFVLGQTVQVTWTASNVSQKVKLQLIRGDALVGLIAGDLNANPSSFAWTVGQTQNGTAAAGTNYKIRIRTVDKALEDASNATFTIAQISAPPPPSASPSYQRTPANLQQNPGPNFALPAAALFTSCTVNGITAESSWSDQIHCFGSTDIVIQAQASSAVQPVLFRYLIYLNENPGNMPRLIYEQPWTEQKRLVINLATSIVVSRLYPNGNQNPLPVWTSGHIFVETKNSTQTEKPQRKQFNIRWYL